MKATTSTLLAVLVLGAIAGILTASATSGSFSSNEFIPVRTEQPLLNPYVGYAPDARGTGYELPFSLVYMSATWRELEPEIGEYDFEGVEQAGGFDKWAAQGKKIILQIVLDNPGSLPHSDLPVWLYAATNGTGTAYDGSIGMGFSPDYADPVLMEAHRRLMTALGERYNADPRIAFIVLGSLGHGGSWHVMQELNLFLHFPPQVVTDVYVDHYLNAFPDKKLLMRRPFRIARKNGMGLYNDMFGNEEATVNQYLGWIEEGYTSELNGESMPEMRNFWVKAPSGGALANGTDGQDWLNSDALQRILAQARLTHVSWLGPNVPDVTEETIRIQAEKLRGAMGYRFSIRSESHVLFERPRRMVAGTMILENSGTAPFYFEWPAVLSLIDESGRVVNTLSLLRDVGAVLPGEMPIRFLMKIPDGLGKGSYRLGFAIVDPETGEPGIQMPMLEKTEDGWYLLGVVTLL